MQAVSEFAGMVTGFCGSLILYAFLVSLLFAIRYLDLWDIQDGWFYAAGIVLFVLVAVIPHGWHLAFASEGLDFSELRSGGFVNHVALFKANLCGALVGLLGASGLALYVSLKRSY
ncbi:hypothetical protein ACVBEG_03120 [Pseudomonas sp. GG8]